MNALDCTVHSLFATPDRVLSESDSPVAFWVGVDDQT